MRYLKENQFIWNDEQTSFVFGKLVSEVYEKSEIFKKTVDAHFNKAIWFNDRTFVIDGMANWIHVSRSKDTDLLTLVSSSFHAHPTEDFNLVTQAKTQDWIFIHENGTVASSFSHFPSHPIHHMLEAINRFVVQGLNLQEVREKLSELEVISGEAGGGKSFTYRGMVLDYHYYRYPSTCYDVNAEIIYFNLENIQRPFEKFSADFYKVVLNSAAVDIAVFDLEQRYMLINEFAVKNKEVRNWLIGRTDFDYCEFKGTDDKMARRRKEFFDLSRDENKMVELEERIEDANGNVRYSLKRFKPIVVQGEVKYMMGFGMDVTPVVDAQDQLQKSLKEKEALLGEIHHRVKNNLTIVYSLLELQAIQAKNADLVFAYRESQSRIKAMALVHEMLYNSHSFDDVDLCEYLKKLADHLQHLLVVNKLVELKFEGSIIELPISTAVTCGLFANEILTNAYKYAIPAVDKPVLEIRLEEVNDFVEMEIGDNGPGLNADFEEGKNASLGFKLMRTFASQLKGDLTIKSEGGLKYLLKFKK